MKDWRILEDNEPAAVLIALGLGAGVLALIWGVRAFARWKVRNARETASELDDFVLGGVTRTKLWLLFFPILYLCTRSLKVPPSLEPVLRNAAILAVIAQVAHWAAGLVDFQSGRYRRRRIETDPASTTTLNVFRVALVAAIWIVAALVALRNLGFDVSALLTGLGIGGIAVALATQNILGDLFASLSIVVDKPFAVGDFIVVGDVAGTVERVGLKSTHIRALSGEQVIIGNADLLKARIHNFKRMAERRVVFTIGVVYQTAPDLLARIPGLIRAAVEKQDRVRFDRSHLVRFGDSAYEFETVYWVTTAEYLDFADIHHAVCLDLVRTFSAEKVEFAYPTRTLLLSPPS